MKKLILEEAQPKDVPPKELTAIQQEILDGSKLIQRFPDPAKKQEYLWEVFENEVVATAETPEGNNSHSVKYHTSYNWFMPEWVKFRDLEVKQSQRQEHLRHCSEIRRAITDSEILSAFRFLVAGIKWYNSLSQ